MIRIRSATHGTLQPMLKKKKDPAAVALGARGGRKRAARMTKKERSESARKAAVARWGERAKAEGTTHGA